MELFKRDINEMKKRNLSRADLTTLASFKSTLANMRTRVKELIEEKKGIEREPIKYKKEREKERIEYEKEREKYRIERKKERDELLNEFLKTYQIALEKDRKERKKERDESSKTCEAIVNFSYFAAATSHAAIVRTEKKTTIISQAIETQPKISSFATHRRIDSKTTSITQPNTVNRPIQTKKFRQSPKFTRSNGTDIWTLMTEQRHTATFYVWRVEQEEVSQKRTEIRWNRNNCKNWQTCHRKPNHC